VLSQHGHGPGKDEVCGIEPGDTAAAHGHELAERGYVVLAPDLRNFGERADWNPPDRYGCDLNHLHLSMLGQSPLALDMWDLARGLDVLSEHPMVDPSRIGMVGMSQGGTMTLFMAAWDRRIAAAVVSGYFSSWAASAEVPWNMCGSQVLPGMLGRLEHVDLAALVAPRPLLLQSGTDDPLFPAAVAAREHAKLATVYEALGCAERLEHDVFDGGHEWRGERPYQFLDHWL
jgi:dienelactone hydrolase